MFIVSWYLNVLEPKLILMQKASIQLLFIPLCNKTKNPKKSLSASRCRFMTFWRRSESEQKKKKTNFVVFGVKKNSYAKFIVLRLMVTRYIGNMIAFLRCY